MRVVSCRGVASDTLTAAKHGIKKVSEELYEFLALATQNRLKDVVDQLGNISKQRLDFYKDEMKIEITSDPRKQLKLIEKREKEEKERRDAEEKERALKDKKMDPEKKKSDQARLEEEEKIRTRTANLTALQVLLPLPLFFLLLMVSTGVSWWSRADSTAQRCCRRLVT